jgi:hypothetical protein
MPRTIAHGDRAARCVAVSPSAEEAVMSEIFVRALRWPVIGLLLIGSVHFVEEALLPDLQTIFVPAVVGPVVLAVGIWLGYRTTQVGGHFGHVLVAGALVGLLPVVVEVGGFGILLDRGVSDGVLTGVFGWDMVFWGSIVGGGFGLGRDRTRG